MVDVVAEAVLAPVTDGASQLALNIFVKSFCNIAVKGAFVSLGDENLVLARCQVGGIEEVFKAFSKKWDAADAAGNLALVQNAMSNTLSYP